MRKGYCDFDVKSGQPNGSQAYLTPYEKLNAVILAFTWCQPQTTNTKETQHLHHTAGFTYKVVTQMTGQHFQNLRKNLLGPEWGAHICTMYLGLVQSWSLAMPTLDLSCLLHIYIFSPVLYLHLLLPIPSTTARVIALSSTCNAQPAPHWRIHSQKKRLSGRVMEPVSSGARLE